MKKKYFSSPINIILFTICMIGVATLIGSIAYLFIDAGMQAKNGSGEYVAPYDFIYFLVIFFILFIAYLLIYLFSVFMFYRRRKDEGENELITVKMTTNLGVGNEEIKKFTKLTKASMVDNDSIEVTPMVPKYSYLSEERNYTKAEIYDFVLFLTRGSIIVSDGALLFAFGLAFVVMMFNMTLFYVLIAILGVIFVIVNVFQFYAIPANFYKRLIANKAPVSLKVFEDRVEESTLLATGDEVTYTYPFGELAIKDKKDSMYIKAINKKVIMGCFIRRREELKEALAYIKERNTYFKKNSK
ncbi:MAG: hypothetical protein J5955_06700 [Bacilli bacterium]|nr:hypothetical protein [Bacilli bacterium]